MKRKHTQNTNLTFISCIAAGIFLLFFWELILTCALLGGILYILWKFRFPLLQMGRNLFSYLGKHCKRLWDRS